MRTRLSGPPFEVLPLHGGLSADEQDHALRPGHGATRRIVVATNIAETSITVPGVRAVVDTGLHKVARYDADRAIDSLTTERIPQDAADQRAGRAGREASGHAIRLWDPRDRLRPHRDAEIHRVDLSSGILDVLAWGGHPSQLDWFERPRQEAIELATSPSRPVGRRDRRPADCNRPPDATPAAASSPGAHADRGKRGMAGRSSVCAALRAPLRPRSIADDDFGSAVGHRWLGRGGSPRQAGGARHSPHRGTRLRIVRRDDER